MKANVGGIDKTVRIIAGLAMIGAGVYFKSWWGLVGLIPLTTALTSFCPLYPLIGFSSCKKEP